jgi:hypothetical protein
MPTAAEKKEMAVGIAVAYAKNMTTAGKGGSLEPLKTMFTDPAYVMLQNADGDEIEFTLGDSEECTMSWNEFADTALKDLEAQNYDCTTSNCLGVLSNRMILETGRVNKDGELYMMATALLEFNNDGKIVGFESFNSVDVDSLIQAVSEKKEEE